MTTLVPSKSVRLYGAVSIVIFTIVAGAAFPTVATAAEIVMTCPAEGLLPELKLTYKDEALLVTKADGDATLSASLEVDPAGTGLFAINGWGVVALVLPDPQKMDECIPGRLARMDATAEDADAVSYVTNFCWREVANAPGPQEVDAEFLVSPGETKQSANVYVTLRYRVPSAVTGKPLQLNDFIFRDCAVLSGP